MVVAPADFNVLLQEWILSDPIEEWAPGSEKLTTEPDFIRSRLSYPYQDYSKKTKSTSLSPQCENLSKVSHSLRPEFNQIGPESRELSFFSREGIGLSFDTKHKKAFQ